MMFSKERFEASIQYLAKGRLPTDEQVIAWAAIASY